MRTPPHGAGRPVIEGQGEKLTASKVWILSRATEMEVNARTVLES